MRPSPYLLICLLLPLSLHNLCLLNYLLCFRLAPIFLFFVFFPLYTVPFFPRPSFIICLFHLLHLCRIYTFSPSSLLQSSFFPPSFKICLLSLLFYFRLFLFFPLSPCQHLFLPPFLSFSIYPFHSLLTTPLFSFLSPLFTIYSPSPPLTVLSLCISTFLSPSVFSSSSLAHGWLLPLPGPTKTRYPG